MNRAIGLVVAVGLVLALGCGRNEPASQAAGTKSEQAAEPKEGAAHAASDVVPGSYEDWCEEHQVAESQCTRCDPSLIPAFQAAGDWDADHGLPLSQCRIHDPKLVIVRPPKPENR